MADPLVPYFQDFLKRISLTEKQRNELVTSHSILRERLQHDYKLSPLIEEIFLQGSYKRNTIVRHKDGKHSDVDIVVVMNLDIDEWSPDEVIQLFQSFLRKHYKGWCRRQTHSWGIKLPNVHMDVIPALFSSEVSYNYIDNRGIRLKSKPLYIPDRREKIWIETNPAQINSWTKEKNVRCNGNFANVVKCIKWWRRVQSPSAKRLKGYPLEYLVGLCCPDEITTVEEGIVHTFNNMVAYCQNATSYYCRELPAYNVCEGMTDKQYNEFYSNLCNASEIANKAYETQLVRKAVALWKTILGDKFV